MSDGADRRSSRASSSTGSSSSFSPSISGFYGADAETAKHVVMLVNDVRQVGGDHVYKPFIRLLKDCAAGRINRKKLIICVHDLLIEHPFLLDRFCKLVPPSLVETNEGSDAPEGREGGREDKGRRRSRRSKDREVVIALEIDDRTISTVAEAEEGRPAKDKKFSNHRWLLPRKPISNPPPKAPSSGTVWWSRSLTVAHNWMTQCTAPVRSHRVSDDPSRPEDESIH